MDKFKFVPQDVAERLDNQIAALMKKYPERKDFNVAFEKFLKDESYNLEWSSANLIQNKLKEQKLSAKVLESGDFKKSSQALLDIIEGDNGAESTYRMMLGWYTGQLKSGLKRIGLEDEFYSGAKDSAIRQQVFNKANNLPDVADKDAVKIAEVLKKINDSLYNDLRAAGLNVRYRNDFIIPRIYDDVKMREVGFDAWRDELLGVEGVKEGKLDRVKTFSDEIINQGKEEEALKEMYDSILDTRRIVSATDDDLINKKSHMNMLKGRKLEFKDGGMEHEFFEKFGRGGNLAESFDLHLDKTAKTYANVERFGTDPGKTWEGIKRNFESAYAGSVTDDQMLATLKKAEKAFKNVVNPPLSGATKLDRAINMVRGLQSFSKLGSSIFMAGYDINATGLQYALRSGENQAKGYIKAFKKFMQVAKMSKEQRIELAERLRTQIHFNDMAIVAGGHKGDYDTGFDRINRAFTRAYKLTGVPQQTELSRLTNAALQAENVFKMANAKKLNDLQLHWKKTYGFTDKDLAILRSHTPKKGEPSLISPQDVMELDLKRFDADPNVAAKIQRDLHDKVGRYIDDAVQKGTPTPTARTKRQMLKSRETDPNVRAISNLVMQFKETAWKIATDNIDAYKTFAQVGGKARANREVFMYMTMGFISYGLIDSIRRELFNQKSIWEELESGNKDAFRNIFFDYLNKSSALPLVTDLADSATSPYYGNNVTNYLGGPTLGMMEDALKIYKNPSQKTTGRFVRRHMFPTNHFLVKAAERNFLEYLLMSNDKIRK